MTGRCGSISASWDSPQKHGGRFLTATEAAWLLSCWEAPVEEGFIAIMSSPHGSDPTSQTMRRMVLWSANVTIPPSKASGVSWRVRSTVRALTSMFRGKRG